MRIGEAAEQVGVSCRTLRYYEELGLLAPSQHSAGGARRYSESDLARLRRIKELQELLGFDLGEIGEILRGEDHLADIRTHYRSATAAQQRQMLASAVAINDRLQAMVLAKQQRLTDMLDQLQGKARRYAELQSEFAAGQTEDPDGSSQAGPVEAQRLPVDGQPVSGEVRAADDRSEAVAVS